MRSKKLVVVYAVILFLIVMVITLIMFRMEKKGVKY